MEDLADVETDRDPSLLTKDQGKAATLLYGAVDRSDVYREVEKSIDALLARHIAHIEAVGRQLRTDDVGTGVAMDEAQRGAKTEEEYAEEATARRRGRERAKEQAEAKRRREEEREKLKEQERKQKAELEKLRQWQADQEMAEQREKERQAKKESERADVEKKRKASEEGLRTRKRGGSEHQWDHEEEVGRTRYPKTSAAGTDLQSSRRRSIYSRSPSRSRPEPAKAAESKVIDEDIEEQAEREALERLLQEGRELAAKSAPTRDLVSSESLEPASSARKSLLSRQALSHPSPRRVPVDDAPLRPRAFRQELDDSTNRSGLSPSFAHSRRSRSRSPLRTSRPYPFKDEQSKDAWKASTRADRERSALEYKRERNSAVRRRSFSPESHRDSHDDHRRSDRRSSSPEPNGRHERSRSPRTDKDRERRRDSTRAVEVADIDRYVPSTSFRVERSKEIERISDSRHVDRRDRGYESKGERGRDDSRRDRRPEKELLRSRDGDRDRGSERRSEEDGHYRDHQGEWEYDRRYTRERDGEIGSTRDRSRDRDMRTHVSRRERDLGHDHRKDRDGNAVYERERDHDGDSDHCDRRDRRYHEYGGYGDRDRSRDRSRERSRDRERRRERERSRNRERSRDRERRKERERSRDKERRRERERSRDRERNRHRGIEKEKGDEGGGDRDRHRHRDHIDSDRYTSRRHERDDRERC